MTALLLDPDCRDSKHQACIGGPCECACHRPDKAETPWPHRAPVDVGIEHGVRWCTMPAPLYGAVNGYAQLPPGHPWRDVDDLDDVCDAHGGITYGVSRSGWVGFDYCHAGDAWPDSPVRFPGDVERTSDEVAAEARRLAHQVANAARAETTRRPG